MNGVVVHAQSRLADASSADAVMVGSGIKTREIVNDPARSALHYVAPVGEKDEYVDRAMRNIFPYV
jgi:hypothetical protein